MLNCQSWTCLNTKLGFTDDLPPLDQYSQVLKALLPETWHGAVDSAVNVCYCSSCRTRSYNNACPGQALLECTVDQLINQGPEHSWKKNDACSPVTSLAGFKYMFTQGVYENIEANLPYDQRPTWFMRLYFSSKCCNLPELFNSTLLGECDFTHFMHYHRFNTPVRATESPYYETASTLPVARDGLNIVDLPPVTQDVEDSSEDPMDCCDMSGFIQPSWRSECDFRLNWNVQDRLTIEKPTITTTTVPTPTSTIRPRLDIKVLPRPCDETTCVFRKLNIVSESGAVDMDAFKQLLNNLTTAYPEWTKGKARVVTKCLTRPLFNYQENCEINKVLACTFDVLSENCPTAPKNDPCKHASPDTSGLVCQISSAKYVPKNRHQPCDLPALVGEDVRNDCLISTIQRLETIRMPNRRNEAHEPVPMCKKLTDSTTCLMTKMGVLNKYQFMDYFKMKDNIRDFTRTRSEWLALNDAYLSAFTNMPMYGEYCSSPKKLLNLIDTMLMTCPLSKRKTSPKCYKMFSEISNSPMQNPNATKVQLDQIFHQFQNIFLPKPTHQNVLRHKVSRKMYDFGILDDGNAPPVRVIDINPTVRPIKVLLPVYQQIYGNSGDMTINMHHDGTLRGGLVRP